MCAHKDGQDVPRGTIGAVRLWIAAAGHLAVWAVMYAAGVAIILGEFLENQIGDLGLVYVCLCAHSGYLLDRIKFRDADLDPADLMAEPGRHVFLRRRAKWLRVLMAAEWIGAATVGVVISPVLGAVVFGGVVVGYLYSGWKPGKGARLKDVTGLKAGLVASAVVGLGLAAVLGESVWDEGLWELDLHIQSLMTMLGLWLIVCGDAVVCDLDDVRSDGVYLTRSLPVLMGTRRAAIIAAGLLVVGGAMVTFGGEGSSDGLNQSRVLFAGMIVASGLGIMRQRKRRDWIDGRMLAVALFAVFVG